MKEKITLVILEDEPAHAEAIRRSLSALPECNIINAYTLQEFQQIIENRTPDLVLADMNLPDGNAFTILKGHVDNQPWPVLVMTSYGDEEMAVKALKSGASDYIVKSPDTFKNISHVVRRNLREWRNLQRSKHAEFALRESEKKFRLLFETMAQGVVYQDDKGFIISANPAAERILGLTLDQMQGKTSYDHAWYAIREDLSALPGDKHPAMVALQTGVPVKDFVMAVFNPNKDDYRWLLVNSIPQFRENETNPYQVFSTFADITELKRSQEALQQKNDELEKARKRAEESDRLKSAFMANMSHEIRTPMNGILGFADLLKSPDLSGESQKKYIEVIEMSGKRMLEIINDLIDISRIEAGQIEIKKEPVNIPELLDELYLFFTPESQIRGIHLIRNIALRSEHQLVETDRTKLAQVITNLIKNALKFTSNNGIVELGCNVKDGYYHFYVKDTGVGIRKELQEKIFERFHQGENSSGILHEGMGLGLAISKAYVELLGGTISLESELSKGSVFSFTLPLKEQVRVEVKDEDIAGTNTVSCSNVLIAEDDESSYALLKEILEINNINTYYASNGLEAVKILKNNKDINLILMDVKMPVMNGLEATRQIKLIRPEIPIIAQSAFVTEADIEQAFQAGCSDYITKPIEKKKLLTKIARYCRS